MTTKVGTLEMSEKAARKPASVEPASSRRTTAFWASRFDSYMLNLSACLGRDSKELRTHPLFSHSSSHSLLVAPSSIQFVSRVSLHIPTEHLDVPRTKQATSFCSWIASVIPLCKVPWWNMAVGGCARVGGPSGDCSRGEAWGRVGARMVPEAPSPHYRGELIYFCG
jgi:hypothetical protein